MVRGDIQGWGGAVAHACQKKAGNHSKEGPINSTVGESGITTIVYESLKM